MFYLVKKLPQSQLHGYSAYHEQVYLVHPKSMESGLLHSGGRKDSLKISLYSSAVKRPSMYSSSPIQYRHKLITARRKISGRY